MTGVVRKWRRHMGVEPETGSPRVFVDRKNLSDATLRAIRDGAEIEFETEDDPCGQRATNVRIAR